MKREDIIKDIHGLDAEMAALEDQYGLLSADFYHFYRAGELEQTRDFIRWAGFYEAKQERENSSANWSMSTCANCAGVRVSALWFLIQQAHELAAG